MPNLFLLNSTVWVHDTDLTAYLNKVSLKGAVIELDSTTFASGGYHSRLGGLKQVSLAEDGFWTSVPDAAQFAALGAVDRAVTVCAQGAETNIAYLFQAGHFTYDQFGGSVGSLAPFTVSMASSNKVGMVRGQLASTSRTISATGQIGSILTLAGPSGSQFLYATFHVFSAGTTLTVIVESAPLVNFAAPVTRATIGPLTVAGGTFMTRVAGPITDGFWRLNATTCTGSFLVGGAIGVQ